MMGTARRRAFAHPTVATLRCVRGTMVGFVMAGLDPAIHLLRKNLFEFDGCAGQARA
jgi:hypothetical protein